MSSAPKRFRTFLGIPLLAAAAAALVIACDAAGGPTAPDGSALAPAAPNGTAAPSGTVTQNLTTAEVARAKAVREKLELRLKLRPSLGIDPSGDLEAAILRPYGPGGAEREAAVGTLRPVEARFREEAVARYELRAVEGPRSGRSVRAEATRLDGTPSQPATFKVKEIAPRQR